MPDGTKVKDTHGKGRSRFQIQVEEQVLSAGYSQLKRIVEQGRRLLEEADRNTKEGTK